MAGHRKGCRSAASNGLPVRAVRASGWAFVTCIHATSWRGGGCLRDTTKARGALPGSHRVCTEMRFRRSSPSPFQLAELLLEHYRPRRKTPFEHLDFTIKELRRDEDAAESGKGAERKEILRA